MNRELLHPNDDENLFLHPIEGCVYKHLGDHIMCFVRDPGVGPSDDDTTIYVGVEVFRSRCELGAWLEEQHPAEDDIKNKVINHLFVEAVFPIEFEDQDKAETQASLGRVDMANSVMAAGGACTICGQQDDHLIGCEYMSWLMYVAAQAVTGGNEPSLPDVVRAAEQQIARMQ
jgi:hypothetical protein